MPLFSRSAAQAESQASLMSTFFMDTRGQDMLTDELTGFARKDYRSTDYRTSVAIESVR